MEKLSLEESLKLAEGVPLKEWELKEKSISEEDFKSFGYVGTNSSTHFYGHFFEDLKITLTVQYHYDQRDGNSGEISIYDGKLPKSPMDFSDLPKTIISYHNQNSIKDFASKLMGHEEIAKINKITHKIKDYLKNK